MALHTAALAFVADVALGSWLGIMAFFSFVGAPRAFAVFDDGAGAYVNDVFPRYYRIGVGLGTLATVALLARGAVTGVDAATVIGAGGAAIGVLLGAYSVWVLVPKMEAAGDGAFERYHRHSVVLNGLMLLVVLLALVGTHLP